MMNVEYTSLRTQVAPDMDAWVMLVHDIDGQAQHVAQYVEHFRIILLRFKQQPAHMQKLGSPYSFAVYIVIPWRRASLVPRGMQPKSPFQGVCRRDSARVHIHHG